jgi:hypothetical protein
MGSRWYTLDLNVVSFDIYAVVIVTLRLVS